MNIQTLKSAVKKALPSGMVTVITNVLRKRRTHEGERLRIKQAARRKTTPVRVVFLALNPQCFNCVQTVYESALNIPELQPYLVVMPYEFTRADGTKSKAIDYYREKYPDAIEAFDGTKWFSLEALHPDIVIRQTQYEEHYPPEYRANRIAQYAKLCFIPYCYNNSPDKHFSIMYGLYFMSYAYAVFAENTSTEKYCQEMKQQNGFDNMKIFFMGYPSFDLQPKPDRKQKNTRVFLWIPRWSLDAVNNDATSFFVYKDVLLNYFMEHPELYLIIRPHPLMFSNFIKNGVMSEEEVEAYRKQIYGMPNVELDSNFDFHDSFKRADAMIADLSALNIEFFLTGKPLLYCGVEQPLDEDTKDFPLYYYNIRNEEDLVQWITRLAEGDDPVWEGRLQEVDRFFSRVAPNIGASIAQKLLEL